MLDRPADCTADGVEPGHRQPHPAKADPNVRPGAEATDQRYQHAAPGDLLYRDIKKLAGSCGSRIGSPAPGGTRSMALAGSTSTCPSTATPGSHSRPFTRMKSGGTRRCLPSRCAALLRPMRHPVQGRAHRQRSGVPLACLRPALQRTRLNALSRPRSENRPTHGPTRTQTSAARSCATSCASTTASPSC